MANDWRVKIADFGLSTVASQSKGTMTACGTPAYTAPEVLRNFNYDCTADVYSFGVCLWEAFTRKTPYKGMPPFQIVFAVGTQNLRPPTAQMLQQGCPPGWLALIHECLDEDPSVRPKFDEILKRLETMYRELKH